MIGNIFISALIAIFFLGKTTKEKEEKTRNASGFRTSVYFLLTVICGIFFYKSYQVSTIRNSIELEAYRGIEDSSGQSKDIARIHIYNKFQCIGSYNNIYLDKQNKYGEDSAVAQYGGIIAEIRVTNSPSDSIKSRTGLTTEVEKHLSKLFGRNLSEMGQFYSLGFLATNIPNFIPICPKKEDGHNWMQEEDSYTCLSYHTDYENFIHSYVEYSDGRRELTDEEDLADLYDNSIYIEDYWIANSKRRSPYYDLTMYCPYPYMNTISVLTAADISQYTYMIQIPPSNDISIKSLQISYNLPIEINQEIEGVHVGSKGIVINEDYLNKINGGLLMLHVKLPTMANLQLIRSLILTALVTSLFSLFCTNFYFWFRRRSLSYKRMHKLNVSILRRIDRRRVALFRNFHKGIMFLFIFCIGYVAGMVLFDKTILLPFEIKWYGVVGFILFIIIILSVLLYTVYKYAITPMPKKRGKEKIEDKKTKINLRSSNL